MWYITPDWKVANNIKAYSTTRYRGDGAGMGSQPPFDELNLALHVGDQTQSVLSNRQYLQQALDIPSEPVWLDQVHSNRVVDISSACAELEPADGAFSSTVNRVCVVMTADCVPVLLCNKQGTKVAAVHAGWRGMAANIVEQAVAMFDQPANEIVVWAGPAISQQYFETGREVAQQFGLSEQDCVLSVNQGKVMLDLYAILKRKLLKLGVTEYSHYQGCTYAEQRFYSYRRDGRCGRMATLIWM